ncbi:hypothetical protein ABEB36_000100 [Hypothenemus hampei]|uniref:Uncharacterized protein n=1 Tax=Hypothenemus hampei TaxID=57062 RepID=A0ABD1FA74_HYPHA
MKGTGSGPGVHVISDPIIEAVLTIVNDKTVVDLEPVCDDEEPTHQTSKNAESEPGLSQQSSRYYLSDDDVAIHDLITILKSRILQEH